MLSNKPTNMVYSLSCLQVSNNLHQKCVQCARTGSGGRHPTSTRRLVPPEMHQTIHPRGQALMPAMGSHLRTSAVLTIPIDMQSLCVGIPPIQPDPEDWAGGDHRVLSGSKVLCLHSDIWCCAFQCGVYMFWNSEFWTTFIWPTLKLSWFGTAPCLIATWGSTIWERRKLDHRL